MKTETHEKSPVPEVLHFDVSTVTGSQEIPFEVGVGSSVRAVADSIAHKMQLPADVSWTLRNDNSSEYLDESRPIGDQLAPGARVSITAKAHLG